MVRNSNSRRHIKPPTMGPDGWPKGYLDLCKVSESHLMALATRFNMPVNGIDTANLLSQVWAEIKRRRAETKIDHVKAVTTPRTIEDVNRDQGREMAAALGPIKEDFVPPVEPVEPVRTLRVLTWDSSPQKDHHWGMILITEDNTADVYFLNCATWEEGKENVITVTIQKVVAHPNGLVVPPAYIVNIGYIGDVSVSGKRKNRCQCKGYTNHGKCRHMSAILKMVAEGRIV